MGPRGDEIIATATFAIAGRPYGVNDATDLLRLVDRGIDQARRAHEGVLVVTAETVLARPSLNFLKSPSI